MADSDTIGVIIPVYNCARYIQEALTSVEAQTLQPDLVVVTDDGGTDDTARLVEQYRAQSNLHIKLIRQSNQGIAAARNTAAQQCDQEYIAFLDGDDVLYPTFLQKAKNALADNPQLILCFTDRDVVDEHRTLLRRDLDEPKFRALDAKRLNGDVFLIRDDPFITLVDGNVIPIGNSMMKKETFNSVGGFDPELRLVEDQSFLLHLTRMGSFGFIDEPLGIWRRHATNTTCAKNAFRMNWYQNLALHKLASQANAMHLDDAQRQAIQRKRKLMPARMLYTAADAGNAVYPLLAAKYFPTKHMSWSQFFKNSLRYGWRQIKR